MNKCNVNVLLLYYGVVAALLLRCYCVITALLLRCYCVITALLLRCYCVVTALVLRFLLTLGRHQQVDALQHVQEELVAAVLDALSPPADLPSHLAGDLGLFLLGLVLRGRRGGAGGEQLYLPTSHTYTRNNTSLCKMYTPGITSHVPL